MMAKMGFIPGQGLGKDNQGRAVALEPTPVLNHAGLGFDAHLLHNVFSGQVPDAPWFERHDGADPAGWLLYEGPSLDAEEVQRWEPVFAPLPALTMTKFCRLQVLSNLQAARLRSLAHIQEQSPQRLAAVTSLVPLAWPALLDAYRPEVDESQASGQQQQLEGELVAFQLLASCGLGMDLPQVRACGCWGGGLLPASLPRRSPS
jgi:hypothetical protein